MTDRPAPTGPLLYGEPDAEQLWHDPIIVCDEAADAGLDECVVVAWTTRPTTDHLPAASEILDWITVTVDEDAGRFEIDEGFADDLHRATKGSRTAPPTAKASARSSPTSARRAARSGRPATATPTTARPEPPRTQHDAGGPPMTDDGGKRHMNGCHYCGTTEAELRPYGPSGSPLCFPCLKADPAREAAAKGNFGALLDATAVRPHRVGRARWRRASGRQRLQATEGSRDAAGDRRQVGPAPPVTDPLADTMQAHAERLVDELGELRRATRDALRPVLTIARRVLRALSARCDIRDR